MFSWFWAISAKFAHLQYRIETKEEVDAYIARLKYILKHDAKIVVQLEREVDKQRDAGIRQGI